MTDVPWPFIGSEALAARIIPERAMRKHYADIYPDVYVPRGVDVTAEQRATAVWLWSKRRGIVSGRSASALLGVKWVEGREPGELVHDNQKWSADLIVRTDALLPREITSVDGISVTTAARTGFDVGRYTVGRLKAVQRLDALMNATDVKTIDIEAVAAAHRGVRGLRRLRRVLPLLDGGAESPQESAARLALVDAGLPSPTTQFEVRDPYGEFIGRVDMAYEEVKVAIEYDGEQHWTDPVIRGQDIEKGVAYQELGWNVIRVGSELLWKRRATYIRRVEKALTDRGMKW